MAHLLVHGALPTASELAAYKTKLKSPARDAGGGVRGAGTGAGERAPDGRDAHRLLGAGHGARPSATRTTNEARDIADR